METKLSCNNSSEKNTKNDKHDDILKLSFNCTDIDDVKIEMQSQFETHQS